MSSGYVRQSASSIITSNTIQASHFNDEYNALQAFADAVTGHNHDGTVGGGAPLTPVALTGLSSDGIVVRSSSSTFIARTITAASSKIAITNGGGVAGNPTVDVTEANLTLNNIGGKLSYSKIQDVSATNRLLGRSTAGAGVIEEITCTAYARTILDDADAATARGTLGLGTSATVNTGTSGTTIPLLDGTNTWANAQTFTSGAVFNGAANTFSGYIQCDDLRASSSSGANLKTSGGTTVATWGVSGGPAFGVSVSTSGTALGVTNSGSGTGLNVNNSGAGAAVVITQSGSGDVMQILDASGDTTPLTINTDGAFILGHTAALAFQNTFGTSRTPNFQMLANADAGRSMALAGYGTGSEANPVIMFARSRSTSNAVNTVVTSSTVLGEVVFLGADGTNYIPAAAIHGACDGTPGTGDMPGRLVFFTTADGAATSTERMRIDSAGLINLGATANVAISSGTQTGATYDTSNKQLRMRANSAPSFAFSRGTTDGEVGQFWRENTQVGNISVTTTATAYNTSSDYRVKEDWQPLIKPATETLEKINIYSLVFKADPEKRVIGLLAHELQENMPEAVTGEKDAVDNEGRPILQGVDYSKLVPLLIAALQETNARIRVLEQA